MVEPALLITLIPAGEKAFGWTVILHDIHLDIQIGEFLTIIDPSGCGKSTLLKIAAGIDMEYNGRVDIHGREVIKPGVYFSGAPAVPVADKCKKTSAGFK